MYRSVLIASLGLVLALQSRLASDHKSGLPTNAREVTDGVGMHDEVLPACSPDGRWLAFEYHTISDPNYPGVGIMRIRQHARSWQTLLKGKPTPRLFVGDLSWSPDSRSLALITNYPKSDSSTMADSDNLQVVKVELSTRKVVRLTNFSSNARLGPTTAWLRSGVIVFSGPDEDIYSVSEKGDNMRKVVRVPSDACNGGTNTLAVSPDEKRIAFTMDSDRDSQTAQCNALWVSDLQTGNLLRIPTAGLQPRSPFWLDGNTILFSGETSNGGERLPVGIYSLLLNTGKVTRLLEGPYLTPFVCDSGKTLYFSWGPKLRDKRPAGGDWPTLNDFYGFRLWKVPLRDVLR